MTRDTPDWVDHLKGDTIPRTASSGLKNDYWTTTQSVRQAILLDVLSVPKLTLSPKEALVFTCLR